MSSLAVKRLCQSILLLVSMTIMAAGQSTDQANLERNYKEAAGAWTYAQSSPVVQHGSPPAQQNQPHHEKYEAQYNYPKQGALVGNPFYGVFPVIFIIGLAALIIIPLLFFTFSPYGFAYSQGQYARKRSIDDFDMQWFKKHIMDLAVNVGEAMDKYGGIASLAMSMAAPTNKVTNKAKAN